MIRAAENQDAERLVRIYNYYVGRTIVTFEEESIDAAEMIVRMEATRSAQLPWLVAEEDGRVTGYAYAARWRPRRAYRFAAETTIYLEPESTGRGLGLQLYGALLALLPACGVHTAIGGIALPNPASVALHEKLGMVKTAHFKEVGYKLGRWIDVGYWQKIF